MGMLKRNWFTGIVNSYIPCKNYHFVTVSCKNLAIMSKIYYPVIIKFTTSRLPMGVEIMSKAFSNWVKISNS